MFCIKQTACPKIVSAYEFGTGLAEVVMDTIIQKNIFLTSSDALSGKQDIRVIDTMINDLYDPPQI